MSLLSNDGCLLDTEDFNFYEEDRIHHVSARNIFGVEKRKKRAMEAEKRIRREIANSNERRRMQSINAGFQSLRALLPRHEGEKLSKAAILQQTAEYIYSLEQEKTRLLSQNCQLKRLLNQHEGGDIPLKKRKNNESVTSPDSTDEKSQSPDPQTKKDIEMTLGAEELRTALDREKRARAALEERVRALEATRNSIFHEIKDECPQSDPVKQEVEVETEQVQVQAVEVPESQTVPIPPTKVLDVKELYLASTSRQNLETIVEAIRHLEGDHLFAEDAPLALTTRGNNRVQPASQPVRPGVIVVKHS